VVRAVRFIPDDQVEPYFKAADAVVIPYVDIFQSGVPFLAFSFGLPVIATDVGSLRDDVTEATGLLCRPKDSADLARAITDFYRSALYPTTDEVRRRIRGFAEDRHSWAAVSERTMNVYVNVTGGRRQRDGRSTQLGLGASTYVDRDAAPRPLSSAGINVSGHVPYGKKRQTDCVPVGQSTEKRGRA
jgi:Glycosyl transferases group 1